MKKVIIIGGGPSGLTAAYELSKNKEYDITILESSDILGGISKTINVNGNRMDIGGHRFFSKDETIMNWWNNILPIQSEPSFDDKVLGNYKKYSKNNANPELQDEVMLIRDRVSRIYYNNKFFDYPISININTLKNMGIFTTLKAGISYLKSNLHKLPEINLENFYINRFGKELYSMFFEGYTEKVWGRHPKDISADWGNQRVKGLSISTILKDMFYKYIGKKDNFNTETSLIEQFYYPKYGPGQLWETVGKKFKENGGHILYNHTVTDINMKDNMIISVKCKTKKSVRTIKGDIFISSMPIKDLINAMNIENKQIIDIANGLPYRDFVTVGILVDKLKLNNLTNKRTIRNIIPDCWIYIQDKRVKLGRIQIFNNWSPYMVEKPLDTIWLGLEYFCNENDDFWNMSDKECIKFALNELIKIGIIDKKSVIKTYREKVKKAYPAYFDTYKDFDICKNYLNNINNLYCIGRNGQHRYNNMDHSMLTALKTVEVINGKDIKDNIWNINIENEYHESKK